MLAEATVLAVPAGLAGMLLAEAGVRLLLASGVEGLPRGAGIGIDARTLAVTAALALLSAVAGSLAPAWRTLRLDLNGALRDRGHGSVGTRRQRLRGGLVVAEMALSVALLLGAGLMLRSLHALRTVDLGFTPQGALTARLTLPEADYPTAEAVAAFHARLLERVRALAGVESAGLVRSLPLGAQIGDWGLRIEGYQPPPGQSAKGDWQVVSDGAVEALGERLLRGRAFATTDSASAEPVGLVNETLARTYWAGRDPIGWRFRMGSRSERPWIRVVGLVGDVRHNGMREPIKAKFYVPFAQFPAAVGFPLRSVNIVVRVAGEPERLAAPLRGVVASLDPRLPLAALRPLDEVVARALVAPRLAGSLLALFAMLALVLAAVGVYGVLAHLVGQRTQEIGVRLALGATGRDVTRLVLRRGLVLSAAGIGLGVLATLGLAQLLRGLLHDVGPHDPLTFAAVPLVLLAVAVLASWLPARTAARLDPLVALRAE
jgi:putative ABC transport system permease protein